MRSLFIASVLTFGLAAQAAPDTKKDMMNMTSTSAKTMNVTVNPLGLAMGSANAQFDFGMGESWSLGARLAYSRFASGATTASGMGIGVGATYYGNGAFRDGFQGKAGLDYMSVNGNSVTVSGTAISALAGYGWFWDGGFNMDVGGGLQMVNLDFGRLGLGSISGTLPALAFNLGYAF